MKIIVLSDTHMPHRAKELPPIVLSALAEADHIIHAGDITVPEVLEALAACAPVTAVAGNGDPPELQQALGETKLVHAGGFVIGVCHGHGSKGNTLERAVRAFAAECVDAVVFGHSHVPYVGHRGGVLLLNPGSPTDKRRNPYYSYGVLETGETLSARIVHFDGEGAVMRLSGAGDKPDDAE